MSELDKYDQEDIDALAKELDPGGDGLREFSKARRSIEGRGSHYNPVGYSSFRPRTAKAATKARNYRLLESFIEGYTHFLISADPDHLESLIVRGLLDKIARSYIAAYHKERDA